MIDLKSEVTAIGEATIRVGGEIDMNTSPKLRELLKSATNQKMKKLIIDLSNVDYMDSSGIATLVECLQDIAAIKGSLVLKSMKPQVKAVFEIAHLTEVFKIVD